MMRVNRRGDFVSVLVPTEMLHIYSQQRAPRCILLLFADGSAGRAADGLHDDYAIITTSQRTVAGSCGRF